MAIISANVQYNRGEHLLLDYSSLQLKYSDALAWAQDPYSNAAVGQFIYIQETETIGDKTYLKGPYVVDVIGEGAILTPLSKGNAGNADVSDIVSELNTKVGTLESNLNTTDEKVSNMSTDMETAKSNISDLQEAVKNIDVPVKGVTVDNVDVVGEDGIAKISLDKYAKSDEVKDTYLSKTDASTTYYTKEQTSDAISSAINGLNPDAAAEDGKYVSGVTLANGKLQVSKADLPTIDIPEYTIRKLVTAEGDAVATYALYKDGDVVDGSKINIPKDLFIKSGEVVELAEGEVEGKVAGTYIKIVLNTGDAMYINTTDLVDVYTGSDYILVDSYQISIKYDGLKSQLVTDFNEVYEKKGVAADLATDAKDSAIAAAAAAVDTKLKNYSTTTEVESAINTKLDNYYTKDQVTDMHKTINDTLNGHDGRLDTLEGLVVGGEGEGVAAIIEDVANLKVIVGTPQVDDEPATGLCKDVIDLKGVTDNAITSIIINNVEAPVSDHRATISLVNDLSNVSDNDKKLAISTGAVVNVIDNIKSALSSKSSIELVDILPVDPSSNVIYLHKDEVGITEKVFIDGEFHIIGSDLYASKAEATSTTAGLMSAADKERFDSMTPITTEDLKGLGIITE